MTENKNIMVDFDGIELAINGALESVQPLMNEMKVSELVIALQKAAQKLAKENNVGSNELKNVRASYNAEKRAAVKAEKEAAKASKPKKEKKSSAEKLAQDTKFANIYRDFAETVFLNKADEKAAKEELKKRLETEFEGLSLAKVRNAYNRVASEGYTAALTLFVLDMYNGPISEIETKTKAAKRYAKAHKLDLDKIAWSARAMNTENAAC